MNLYGILFALALSVVTAVACGIMAACYFGSVALFGTDWPGAVAVLVLLFIAVAFGASQSA